MGKKFFVVMLFLFLFNLVSAHDTNYDFDEGYIYKEKITETKYFPDEHFTWSRTTYIDYENDERFPTYDYRHGYTYRSTTDYLDKHYGKEKLRVDYEKREVRKSSNQKDYSYEYGSHLGIYEKRECYNSAPRDKLFYIKC